MTLSTTALAALAGAIALCVSPSMAIVPLLVGIGFTAGACLAPIAPRTAVWIAIATTTLLLAALHAHRVLANRWPVASEGARALVTATIESIPVADASGWRFDALLRLEREPGRNALRARVMWADPNVRVAAGERWRLLMALHAPSGRVNPHGHDVERQLFRERVHATGRVLASRVNSRLDTGASALTQLRAAIAERVASSVGERDAAALIAALAVGHGGAMSREQWRVFNATGTTHLVAISGMHVTLFAVLAMAAARQAWRLVALRISPRREDFAAACGLAAAGCYAMLAGFSVPTQRTLIMLAAWLAVRSSARHLEPATPLAVAAIVVIAIDPFAPLAAGFWLSFLAMAAIVLVTSARVRADGRIAEALRVQLAVTLVLAPATLMWFGGVSLVGTLVNLAAIPIVSFIFVPLVLLGVVLVPVPAAAEIPWGLAAQLHDALWPWLVAAADQPAALLFGAPPLWWLVGAAVAAFLAVFPWPPMFRLTMVLWLVPLAPLAARLPETALELTLLDTGRNASFVVRTSGHALVYGIGEGYGTRGGTVMTVLLPFLRGRGIRRLDELVIDGTGQQDVVGLNALLAALPVARVISNRAFEPCTSSPARWNAAAIQLATHEGRCRLELSLGASRVRVHDGIAVIRIGSTRPPYVLLAGPRWRPARQAPLLQALEQEGAVILATSTSGAITVRLSPGGLEQLDEARSGRAALWRVATRVAAR